MERNDLVSSGGYFVYYDKNQGMQDYMMENKLVKMNYEQKEPVVTKSEKSISFKNEELKAIERKRKTINTQNIRKAQNLSSTRLEENHRRQKTKNTSQGSPINATLKRNEPSQESKRLINMLVSMSAVLLLVCFIMGAGLVQNSEKISDLQITLQDLDNSYSYLTNNLKQGVVPVFATQDETASIGNELVPHSDNIETEPFTQSEQPILDEVAPVTEKPLIIDEPVSIEEPIVEAPVDPEPVVIVEVPVVVEAPVIVEVPAQSIQTNVNNSNDDIPKTYTVQKGDNINFISLKFYGTSKMADAIIKANGLENADMIYFGKVLILPPAN